MKTSGSKPKQLNGADWHKIATGFGLAVIGAVAAWAAGTLIPSLESEGKLAIAALVGVLVNAIRKWMTDQRPTVGEITGLQKVAKACLLFALVIVFSSQADARPRVRRVQSFQAAQIDFGSTPQDVVSAKAAYMARLGSCFHPGGSFGGCPFEGVGSGLSAAHALANCCYTGQLPLVASAAAQGANGWWFACKLFNAGSVSVRFRTGFFWNAIGRRPARRNSR